ncbi:MAG: esterase family protein [Clostridia bacterium]|nr:esterase family protein [Clostridia bacterium]
MAFLQLNYHSDALKRGVGVNVILPEKAKTLIGMDGVSASTYKTLYLFHGLSDDQTIWMRRTSIERYAAERGIAVVMPTVGRSWYTDTATGEAYLTFVTKELPTVCQSYFRGMSDKREDNFVAGLSMGGYGAIKAALTRPDLFSGCASLSGALDIASFGERPELKNEWRGIFGFELQSAADLSGSRHDLFTLIRRAKESGGPLPRIFLWCGSEDYLLDHNHRFRDLLTELDIPHRYEESEGNHSWIWWDLHIADALDFLLDSPENK